MEKLKAEDKKKRPYYYWYASDFLGSSFVQGLDLAAECCYRRLLDIQATSDNHRIPDDSDTLRKQCKKPPVAQWSKIWAQLRVKFQPHPDGKGGLINPRLHEILQEADDYLTNKSKAGKLGMQKRWGGDNSGGNKPDNRSHNKPITSTSISNSKSLIPEDLSKHSKPPVPEERQTNERAAEPLSPEVLKAAWVPVEIRLRKHIEPDFYLAYYEGTRVEAFTGTHVILAVPGTLIRNKGGVDLAACDLADKIQHAAPGWLKGRSLQILNLDEIEANA